MSDAKTEIYDTKETVLVQELQQKLTMAATKLETVRAELSTQLQ